MKPAKMAGGPDLRESAGWTSRRLPGLLPGIDAPVAFVGMVIGALTASGPGA